MSLRKILIKSDYDSYTDDVYHDFYSRILSRSNNYYRLGGFFSSERLAYCSEGLEEFIKNNGNMKLVLTPRFTEEDLKAIQNGILRPEEFIDRTWIREFDMIKDKFQSDHVRALAWMIANRLLEIRIALIKDQAGNLLSDIRIKNEGILGEQVGIVHDEEGNSLSFRGIINSIDIEKLRTFKGWIEGQKEYVNNDYQLFQQFWDFESENLIETGNSKRYMSTIPLTTAVRDKFLSLSPKSADQIKLIKLPKLFDYQKKAVTNWLSNNRRGIFEMATGTGKTFTAIGCIKAIEKENDLAVVIVCPYINLVSQWKSELDKWGYTSIDTLSSKKKWLSQLISKIMDLTYGINGEPVIIITTYDTFSTKQFINMIKGTTASILLIADEVHSAGSDERRFGLIENYKYRLGLVPHQRAILMRKARKS
ncbi:MAG: DEAD/DEAH box helicase family protein [Nitrososphaerales archaeon]